MMHVARRALPILDVRVKALRREVPALDRREGDAQEQHGFRECARQPRQGRLDTKQLHGLGWLCSASGRMAATEAKFARYNAISYGFANRYIVRVKLLERRLFL
jgi:hypothetical protein